MIAKVFCLLTVAVSISHGLVTHGGCPAAPATHMPHTRGSFDWVLGIPFSESTQSNLFVEVNPFNRGTLVILLLSWFKVELNIESDDGQCTRSAVGTATSKNDIKILKYRVSVVDKFNISSEETVFEEVRMWTEGQFLFIWSCVNLAENTHDEAVLLIWSSRPSNRSYPNLVNLREAAGKYLEEPIINAMMLTLMTNESVGGIPFKYCSAEESTFYFIIITLLFVCIVMLFTCL